MTHEGMDKIKLYYMKSYHNSIEENGVNVVKEGFVVERVGSLQDDGRQEVVEEELRSELWEVTVEFSILNHQSPQHSNNNQETQIYYEIVLLTKVQCLP